MFSFEIWHIFSRIQMYKSICKRTIHPNWNLVVYHQNQLKFDMISHIVHKTLFQNLFAAASKEFFFFKIKISSHDKEIIHWFSRWFVTYFLALNPIWTCNPNASCSRVCVALSQGTSRKLVDIFKREIFWPKHDPSYIISLYRLILKRVAA